MDRLKKGIALMIISVCRLFPIKHHKILFYSYYGAQYGCNPKYISEYIIKNSPLNKFDIVWAFQEPSSKEVPESVRKVKMMSLKYFYELCTAKIIITNFRTTKLFMKRKDQYYIQTWHSSLRLKQIEKDAGDFLSASYIDMAKKDSAKCDLLLSGCQLSTDIFKRSFWYTGEIFKCGTPRNDIIFQENHWLRETVLSKLNIPIHKKVLLYAPTFRKNNNSDVYDLDYLQVRKAVEKKIGGDWIVFVKFHPHLISETWNLTNEENVVNVTAYDDIQELLVVADVLISDYSSLIFDFAMTKRPCFLYVPDFQEYIKKERKLYFRLEDLPFISVASQEKLVSEINSFHPQHYEEKMNEFLKEIGSFENGNASEFLLKRVDDVCFKKERDGVYETV